MKNLVLGMTLLASMSVFAESNEMYDFSVKIKNNAPGLVTNQEIMETLNINLDKQGCKVSYIKGLLSPFQSGGLEVKVFKSGTLSVRANYAKDQFQIITINHENAPSTVIGKLESLFQSTESNLLNGIKCN